MKAYLGRSTGSLSIIHWADQYRVMDTLASEGYDGVLVGHFEKESLMNDRAYDPEKPITWSTKARPEIAEISSFADGIQIAEDVKFPGKIHVAHVSTLPVIDFISNYTGNLKISCGVTPHHLFFDNTYLEGEDGAWFKCNPPLRSQETQSSLLIRLLDGRIPIIESDHAPHTEQDKSQLVPASGIISGPIWPYLERELLKELSSDRVQEVVASNAINLYDLQNQIEIKERKVDYSLLDKVRKEYPHDPFTGLMTEGC